jgi:DNA-binding GntR family transcriptional regulator
VLPTFFVYWILHLVAIAPERAQVWTGVARRQDMSTRIGDEHRPLRVVVCDEIRRRILGHEYAPGERLIEEHIAEELAVSRNPVREALRVLEAEGFVQILPRKGAVVADLDVDHEEELYEILLHLESLAAQFAARKATDDDAASLLDIVQRSEQAAAAEDFVAVAELNSEFHTAVVGVARNSHLASVLAQMRTRNRGFSHIGPAAVARLSYVFEQKAGERGRAAAAEHRALAEAIIAGDEVTTVNVAQAHIEASRRAFSELAEVVAAEEPSPAATA